MGVTRAREIASALTAAGMAPSTPAAVIQNVSLPDERTLTTTLAELAAAIAHHGITSPAIIVIGTVVRFAIPPSLPERAPLPLAAIGCRQRQPARDAIEEAL